MTDVLPSKYCNHFALLVWAIHRLLSDKIEEDDIEKSQEALDDFCRAIPALYGE